MRPRARRRLLVILLACVSVLVLTAAGFAVDASRHSETVTRNVELDGSLIGGETEAELAASVERAAQAWAEVPVTLDTPAGEFSTTLTELGVTIDEAAVTQAALDAGRSGSALADWWSWLTSPFTKRAAALSFALDEQQATEGIAEAEQANHVDPTEPTLVAGESAITVAAGADGATLDNAEIARRAKAAAERGERSIRIEVGTTPLPPKVSAAEADVLADQATDLASEPLGLYLDGKSGRFDPTTIRSWFIPSIVDGRLAIEIDAELAAADIDDVLGTTGKPPQQLRFDVDLEGKVVIIDGAPGTTCCTPESLQGIVTALEAGTDRVDLQLAATAPDHDRAWAEQLGITAPIATFTTNHPCCAPRVANIHRFADLIRGTVIEPDATMSSNDTVGQRTEERGFVSAPVIVDGEYDEAVGGGVSQFAVTLFNAAFYGGLDIPEYQAHTIYIDRYPYGVESTISWGGPDLKLHNNTPYGVLIWPTYTDTSITVTLYSTPYIKGEMGPQTKEQKGPCTKVTTERLRTVLGNGDTSTDTFTALYQPGEGVTC